MLKCTACGGTYDAVGADGAQYFHTCPPLSATELAAAVLAGKVVLPALETADVAVTRRTYVRANFRDENLKSTAAKDAGSLKAVGAGTTIVAAPPSPIVVVP